MGRGAPPDYTRARRLLTAIPSDKDRVGFCLDPLLMLAAACAHGHLPVADDGPL